MRFMTLEAFPCVKASRRRVDVVTEAHIFVRSWRPHMRDYVTDSYVQQYSEGVKGEASNSWVCTS